MKSTDTGSALLEAMLTQVLAARMEAGQANNRGSAGMDGLDIAQTADYLKAQWPEIRQQLLMGDIVPAGAPGDDSQAGWRSARAGHTDGAGSSDPARLCCKSSTLD